MSNIKDTFVVGFENNPTDRTLLIHPGTPNPKNPIRWRPSDGGQQHRLCCGIIPDLLRISSIMLHDKYLQNMQFWGVWYALNTEYAPIPCVTKKRKNTGSSHSWISYRIIGGWSTSLAQPYRLNSHLSCYIHTRQYQRHAGMEKEGKSLQPSTVPYVCFFLDRHLEWGYSHTCIAGMRSTVLETRFLRHCRCAVLICDYVHIVVNRK
jgi:hypothetical protein